MKLLRLVIKLPGHISKLGCQQGGLDPLALLCVAGLLRCARFFPFPPRLLQRRPVLLLLLQRASQAFDLKIQVGDNLLAVLELL